MKNTSTSLSVTPLNYGVNRSVSLSAVEDR